MSIRLTNEFQTETESGFQGGSGIHSPEDMMEAIQEGIAEDRSMTTLTIRSEVGPDGTLRLEIPSGLTPGPVEVVVVVQPVIDRNGRTQPVRSGIFLNRGLVGVDVDAVTAEMDAVWKARLADLGP